MSELARGLAAFRIQVVEGSPETTPIGALALLLDAPCPRFAVSIDKRNALRSVARWGQHTLAGKQLVDGERFVSFDGRDRLPNCGEDSATACEQRGGRLKSAAYSGDSFCKPALSPSRRQRSTTDRFLMALRNHQPAAAAAAAAAANLSFHCFPITYAA